MKTLVNCTPTEFMSQTYKIKEAVSQWLTDTDILNIRKKMPEGLIKLEAITSEEDRAKANENNKKLIYEQSRKNLNVILDALLKEHPEETLKVLALICFIEPEDIDTHPVRDYLLAINEIIGDEAVLGFFISLARLGQLNML